MKQDQVYTLSYILIVHSYILGKLWATLILVGVIFQIFDWDAIACVKYLCFSSKPLDFQVLAPVALEIVLYYFCECSHWNFKVVGIYGLYTYSSVWWDIKHNKSFYAILLLQKKSLFRSPQHLIFCIHTIEFNNFKLSYL